MKKSNKSTMKAKGVASAFPQSRMAKPNRKPMSEDFKPSGRKAMPAGMMKAKGKPPSASAREKRLKDMPL